MAKILILGGGFGGVAAARRLRSQLGDEHEIVVIDRRDTFMVGFRKTWVLLGERPLEEGQRNLSALEKQGIRYLKGSITKIMPEELSVEVDGSRLEGDALVIALGAELAPQTVPGLAEHALNVYDPAQLASNAEAIRAFQGGKVLVGVFGKPYKCPPAPYELAILLKEALEARGVQASYKVFTPLPASLPVLGPEGCSILDGYLFMKGIPFLPNHVATSVEPGLVHFESGKSLEYDLLLAVAPHRAPQVVRDTSLVQGPPWIKVDPKTLETGIPNVYAVGDVTMVPMANGNPLPKAGVFAEGEGLVVADRIAAGLKGLEPQAVYEGRGGCFLEIGDDRAVMVEGHFLAEGNPQVAMTEPSSSYLDDKWAFESSRLQEWFS